MKIFAKYLLLTTAVFLLATCQEMSTGEDSSDGSDTTDTDSSQTEPIYISTVEGLFSITDNLAGDYILTTDISLSGYEWTPIGSEDEPFAGTFDGDGYRISDLNIEVSSGDIAFFAYLEEESEVSNLTLEGNVKTEDGSAALLALYCEGIIKNCHTRGTVEGESAGGLVNYCHKGTIQSCSSTGSVSGNNDVGGLAGKIGATIINDSNSSCNIIIIGDYGNSIGGFIGHDNGSSVIYDCYSTGEVLKSSNSYCQYIGGFIGSLHYTSIIHDCYSTSNINIGRANNSVGGFIGVNRCATIYNCYCSGQIVGDIGSSTVGGFIGENNNGAVIAEDAEAHIENCYCTGNVTGTQEIGGFAGNNNEGVITECHSTGLVHGQYILGGFTGINDGNITNCYSTGSVEACPSDEVDAYAGFGGFVGWIQSGNLNNCYSSGNVTVPTKEKKISPTSIGGFAGEFDLCGNGEILNCRSAGNVTVGDFMDSVGGFIGNAAFEKMFSCFCTGNVSCGSNAKNIGGFAGYCYVTDMSLCFNTGNVNVEGGSEYIGGFIGYYSGNVALISTYSAATITISGTGDYIGGLIGYSSYSNSDEPIVGAYFIDSNYDNFIGLLKTDGWDNPETFDEAVWDFDNDWEIDENRTKNDGYPYLKSVPLFM